VLIQGPRLTSFAISKSVNHPRFFSLPLGSNMILPRLTSR
jgi:hypothetical protein